MLDSLGNEINRNNAIIFRATEVPVLLDCPRKWYFSSHNGMNLEPKVQDHKLSIGTIWHEALENYYANNMNYQEAKKAMDECYDKEVEKVHESLGDEIFEEEKKKLEEGKDILDALLEIYPDWARNTEPSDAGFEVVAVEERLLMPIGTANGETIYIACKIDGLVKQGDFYWILEHKTRSKSDKVDSPDNLVLDVQMTLQIICTRLYLQQVLGVDSSKLVGVIYNLARKQKPSSRVKNPIFGRHVVRRNRQELMRFLEMFRNYVVPQYRAITNKLSQYYFTIPYNPQLQGKCSWGCSFTNPCEAICRGEDVEISLTTSFKKRDKDIFETLEEEMRGEI